MRCKMKSSGEWNMSCLDSGSRSSRAFSAARATRGVGDDMKRTFTCQLAEDLVQRCQYKEDQRDRDNSLDRRLPRFGRHLRPSDR